jgi:endoribonuclease Nob1
MVALVLDASAFLSGRITSMPSGHDMICTTSAVRNEVQKGSPGRILENLLSAGLRIKDPISTEDAVRAAKRTGDLDKLSDADISIIALAGELNDVLVLTDDFRIQNVLKSLYIRFEPAGELGSRTIKEIWTWTYRCSGCGRYFDSAQKNDDCPICGSSVKKKRKR